MFFKCFGYLIGQEKKNNFEAHLKPKMHSVHLNLQENAAVSQHKDHLLKI